QRGFDRGWERQPAGESAQIDDACALKLALGGLEPDLIVVDHYLLDLLWEERWEQSQVAVIDDLANRGHACTWLVDQNLGASAAEYRALVRDNTRILVGASYALLRPEFAEARPAALAKRAETDALKNILVNFGASDVGG